ncbi:Cytosolic endo-beta-N-acetylglucosaminidase [Ooceraea biroi]|uniref:Cytosolic endo-beta-N-acetylglucosaminidase n=1 Tax=Ooceraea biroi TaxID=2015173 RepID=A0A026WMX4_OOCBI|nr:Cytosolic endo-beta-N-acetylglucosaminidase [Ooceraea biroi]
MASSLEPLVSAPFKTLSELYDALDVGLMIDFPSSAKWLRESADYAYRGSDINKEFPRKLDRLVQPRTLVCHDMKGGYLEDRFLRGSTSHDSYVFYHWNVIDTFVYFSHHFVTIPPVGWINAAHSHGVKVLGTVITEGNNDTWDVILESQESLRRFADALVLIAKCYQFEGWLLNVENTIKREDVDNLVIFMTYLTERSHIELGVVSEIIWYDSVINSGELSWQNELNDKNKEFYLACDGIFLNYNWTESRLINSHKYSLEIDCGVTNIYVGLDVWGRGCPGGGGLNSAYAMNLIRKHGLSVAIFAPGWTHEHFGPSTFRVLEDLFWAQLFPYLYVHVPIYEDETFKTSFCRGAGPCYYYNGEEHFNLREINGEGTYGKKAFYNLRVQQPQLSVPVPHLQFTRSIQRAIIDNNKDSKDKINRDRDADDDGGNDKADKDKEAKKPETRVEHVYENSRSTVRIRSNVISFENKLSAPDDNTFEFCDIFSFEGGGCLKLVTRNPRSYHRLFFIHFSSRQFIQATIIYARSESNPSNESENSPILVLGSNGLLKWILPFSTDFVRLNDKWKKCVYLTDLKTVDQIGVSFQRQCEGYLGSITLEKREHIHGE